MFSFQYVGVAHKCPQRSRHYFPSGARTASPGVSGRETASGGRRCCAWATLSPKREGDGGGTRSGPWAIVAAWVLAEVRARWRARPSGGLFTQPCPTSTGPFPTSITALDPVFAFGSFAPPPWPSSSAAASSPPPPSAGARGLAGIAYLPTSTSPSSSSSSSSSDSDLSSTLPCRARTPLIRTHLSSSSVANGAAHTRSRSMLTHKLIASSTKEASAEALLSGSMERESKACAPAKADAVSSSDANKATPVSIGLRWGRRRPWSAGGTHNSPAYAHPLVAQPPRSYGVTALQPAKAQTWITSAATVQCRRGRCCQMAARWSRSAVSARKGYSSSAARREAEFRCAAADAPYHHPHTLVQQPFQVREWSGGGRVLCCHTILPNNNLLCSALRRGTGGGKQPSGGFSRGSGGGSRLKLQPAEQEPVEWAGLLCHLRRCFTLLMKSAEAVAVVVHTRRTAMITAPTAATPDPL
eukprot:Hpha_TRINITY_DN15254_c3_g5::TRINITY_DN15254_c3_g5_i1::g.65857::m.65857